MSDPRCCAETVLKQSDRGKSIVPSRQSFFGTKLALRYLAAPSRASQKKEQNVAQDHQRKNQDGPSCRHHRFSDHLGPKRRSPGRRAFSASVTIIYPEEDLGDLRILAAGPRQRWIFRDKGTWRKLLKQLRPGSVPPSRLPVSEFRSPP